MIKVKPLLLIDRSSSVNAYALGGNVIAVNLGLIDFAKTREELALAIAHELSHNILDHVDNVMKERAEWLTSDEYKASLNAVLDSKYERFTRLKKVLENYSFDRSRHQRYHESDADSLAVILLKKSKIAFDANFFLRLDSADLQYKLPLQHPLKEYFSSYRLSFEDSWA
jgi:predicted Zn-dependent protease